MNLKLKLSVLIIFISIFGINAQKESVNEINSFIKDNSSGNKNYWSRIDIQNNNLLIYNTSRNTIGKYSFPISKIDANSIKASKKRVLLKSNTEGQQVTYMFGVERKESVAAILIYNMSKANRSKLSELLSSLIIDLQKKEHKN